MKAFNFAGMTNREIVDHLDAMDWDADGEIVTLTSALMVAFDRIDQSEAQIRLRPIPKPGPIRRALAWVRGIPKRIRDDLDAETPSDWQIRQW